MASFTTSFKLVLVGETRVGKTSLVVRFVDGTFPEDAEPTIGAFFLTKPVRVGTRAINLQVWDTAGQERFRSMTPMYYRGAHGALVVLDVTSEASFHAAKEWVTELRAEARPGLVLMLVCNKVDLAARRVVSGDRCAALARSVGALCVETSAKDDVGVGPAFYDVAVAMLKRFGDSDAAEAARGPQLPAAAGPRHSWSCC